MERKVSHRKQRSGVVISDAADKTIVVKVTRIAKHPLYRKRIKINKKYHAHDEKNLAKNGDIVNIIECRPFSKTKRWRLQEVVEGKKA